MAVQIRTRKTAFLLYSCLNLLVYSFKKKSNVHKFEKAPKKLRDHIDIKSQIDNCVLWTIQHIKLKKKKRESRIVPKNKRKIASHLLIMIIYHICFWNMLCVCAWNCSVLCVEVLCQFFCLLPTTIPHS